MSEPKASPQSPDLAGTLAPARIVVRGLNWLGDAVMSTAALLALRDAFPQAHLTLWISAKLADLFRGHPACNEVQASSPGQSLRAAASALRCGRFDLGVILPNSHRAALELWLAGVPRRVGIARPGRAWLLTDAIAPWSQETRMRKLSRWRIRQRLAGGAADPHFQPPASAHQVYHYLHLVAALGAGSAPRPPWLHVTREEVTIARAKFGLVEDGGPWLGLNAGAEYGPAKRWPAERFAAAAAELQRRRACRWVILGGPADVQLASEIVDLLGHRGAAPPPPAASIPASAGSRWSPLNLAGRTSLRELCAVAKICRLVLTNDTGPMHVAAAVGTPVVVPFGSTSPMLTGPGWPGDPRHRLLTSNAPCAPCFRRDCPIDLRCLRGIDATRVVQAMEDLLQGDATPAGELGQKRGDG
jgi:heptosyltransferase-2